MVVLADSWSRWLTLLQPFVVSHASRKETSFGNY